MKIVGSAIAALADFVLDAVFPANIYCIGCGAVIDKSHPYSLCGRCLSHFHFASDRTCLKCGKLLEEGYQHSICRDCRAFEREFERGYTCMLYGLYEKEMIRAFKYKDRSYYAYYLGELMYDRIAPIFEEEIRADIVVPVPLHRKKLAKRGYNQAELLAQEVAARLFLPEKKALIRTVNTKPMSRLSGIERRENLQGAFAVPPQYISEIKQKCILLIDDIFTSGSTADACARTLKSAGASAVVLLSLAAGGNSGARDGDEL